MSSQGAPDTKPAPDWERIEADYRAGLLSLREIAAPFEITEGAIRKRAKAKGWSRDLSAKIKARAEELVRKDAVRAEGTQPDHRVPEQQIVEANAEIVADVDRRHKRSAKKGQALVDKLLSEVEGITDSPELAQQLFELLNDPHAEEGEGKPPSKAEEERLRKMREAFERIMSLPGRVDSLKKLAETFEKFAKFERVAYRLEESAPPPNPDEPITPERQAEGVRRLAFLLTKTALRQPEPAHG